MHPAIIKAFGGVSTEYYIKHLLIGAILPLIGFLSPKPWAFWVYPYVLVSCLLYPYARFTYEGLLGKLEQFLASFLNGNLEFLLKLWVLLFCWVFAIVIAPIGLAYLYLREEEPIND